MSEERIRRNIEKDAQALKECFSNDNRFVYGRMIANGTYGSAHRVQYIDRERPGITQFIVKKSLPGKVAEEAMRNEREYIMRLRGAMHIVQIVDIRDNPLQKYNLGGEWIILEWIENGTLGNFILNAVELGITRLPNRLLWRFFLCMIRACCGMAWPRNRTDGLVELEVPIPLTPAGELEHADLHDGNVLLGEFIPYGEHDITPILKVIDFGQAYNWDYGHGQKWAVPANVFQVGKLMAALICMNMRILHKLPDGNTTNFKMVGEVIETWGHALYHLDGSVANQADEWLVTLVAACLAVDAEKRPTLQDLTTHLPYAILNRHQLFYNDHFESNESVKGICQEILFHAPC